MSETPYAPYDELPGTEEENDRLKVSQDETTQIEDVDDGTGSSNAAQLDLGTVRQSLDIFVSVSGPATLTVEASTTGEFGGEERKFDSVDYSQATTEVEQYSTMYRYMRAYLDKNRNVVEMVSRGMS